MNSLVLLAKQAVENYVENKKMVEVPVDFPKDFLTRRAGVFVTIEKGGNLRGCIGTYLPVRENIGEEIIHNAISAATQDDRFGAVKKTELPHLSYTVSILNPPEKIKDISELDPKKFGVIVKSGRKSGLLLPDLEGVNTVAEQINICCQKGGIYLKEGNIEIYKFTIEKHQ
jgi:AmmeMemoRadiSam system protein A